MSDSDSSCESDGNPWTKAGRTFWKEDPEWNAFQTSVLYREDVGFDQILTLTRAKKWSYKEDVDWSKFEDDWQKKSCHLELGRWLG